MDRASAKLTFPERPRHPKGRDVIYRQPEGSNGLISLSLECGHRVRRRFDLCEASRIICDEC
jgi:hypothetical protein